MQPYILGVDIGTGSTKSIAVSLTGEVLSVAQFHYPVNAPQPGFSEQDPDVVWHAFVQSIQTQVQKLRASPNCICLSSAMHSVIPVNENGKQLMQMMTWADGRSAEIANRIKASAQGEGIYKNTGTPIHAMSPLCKIIWLRENKKELFEKTYKFISIKEFIWFKLFNEFKVDISIASATGLLNILSNQWHTEALALAGITEEKLSLPLGCNYTSSHANAAICKTLGLAENIPFIIGASDGCFANVGSNVMDETTAAVTIGTSGAVQVTSTKPVYNYEAMIFNYKLDEDTYISGGAINNGGNILQWFLHNFYDKKNLTDEDYNHFFSSLNNVKPGSNGLIFLPYLNGERAPYWDTKSSGSFIGITALHEMPHFSRAVIEGICYALYDVLQSLKTNEDNISQLNVSGGFVTSDVWVQILADISGKRTCLLHHEDASALGAAYFGLKTMGLIENYSVLFNKQKAIYVEPSYNNHNLYKKYFDIYKSLYKNLKHTMHELYNLNRN